MLTTPTRHRRTNTRTSDVFRTVVRAIGHAAFVMLAGFHGWLLCTHATMGKLVEPEVAVRWSLAVLLVAAFLMLRRLGRPLFSGRRAVVLWTLVVLIHCHAVWTGDTTQVQLAVPQNIVEVGSAGAQLAAAMMALLFLAGLALQYDARHRGVVVLGPATVGAVVPNIDVKPETGHNIDLGLKVRAGRYAASLSVRSFRIHWGGVAGVRAPPSFFGSRRGPRQSASGSPVSPSGLRRGKQATGLVLPDVPRPTPHAHVPLTCPCTRA